MVPAESNAAGENWLEKVPTRGQGATKLVFVNKKRCRRVTSVVSSVTLKQGCGPGAVETRPRGQASTGVKMGWPSSPRRWPDFQSIRLRGLAGQTRSLRLTTSTRSFPRQPAQNSRTELSLAPFTCTLAVSNAPLVAPPLRISHDSLNSRPATVPTRSSGKPCIPSDTCRV